MCTCVCNKVSLDTYAYLGVLRCTYVYRCVRMSTYVYTCTHVVPLKKSASWLFLSVKIFFIAVHIIFDVCVCVCVLVLFSKCNEWSFRMLARLLLQFARLSARSSALGACEPPPRQEKVAWTSVRYGLGQTKMC